MLPCTQNERTEEQLLSPVRVAPNATSGAKGTARRPTPTLESDGAGVGANNP
jgi:hypothetical protein